MTKTNAVDLGTRVGSNHHVRIPSEIVTETLAPIGKHSAKPAEVRDRIVELFGDISRIELFARQRVKGWESHGLELDAARQCGSILVAEDGTGR
ncbi:hypothetical protein LCGC14_0883820 [marine sediment metagenome]|uniref:Uncharacterized protein n=1 Tax=marine sediment metagenome TaxID=412755 RepID=A0A0F9P633_9ZZZZ